MRTERQRMGQHFLSDERIAQAIVDALPGENRGVIEIGPGKGALTMHLIERFTHVRVIELDANLAATLPRRLGKPSNLEVIRGDALRIDLDELATDGPFAVVGNLPYSVGTPIIRRFLPHQRLFQSLTFMVQSEVANRLVALPGDSDRGFVTLEVEAFSHASLLFVVPPRCFDPPPKVHSAVVHLDLHPLTIDKEEAAQALRLASVAFQHRRKKLPNALASLVTPQRTLAALDRAGIDSSLRAEDLTWEQWLSVLTNMEEGQETPA